MEAQEELVGSNDHTQIIKRKRTKRRKPSSPYSVAMTSSSSCGGGGGTAGGGTGIGGDYNSIYSPTTSSDEIYESTEEEEDMANCLILLAKGDGPNQIEDGPKMERCSSRRFTEATTSTGKAGFYVYQCKTCDRTFPSFQALGGHRASHKKPKHTVEEKKTQVQLPSTDDFEERQLINRTSPPLSLQIPNRAFQSSNNNNNNNNNKTKIHECSICGAEFTSGQALGGHMRRHRAAASISTTQATTSIGTCAIINSHEAEKPRNILPLDLNLPAPEDDHHSESNFQFVSTQPPLVFSAPALVDCHY